MQGNAVHGVLTVVFLAACVFPAQAVASQTTGTLVVRVTSAVGPVAQAEVRAANVSASTDANGEATLTVPTGTIDVVVSRFGFETARRSVTISTDVPTRITVELILEKLAAGETFEQLLDAHPRLTREAIQAALAFGAQALRADVVYPLANGAA